MTQWDITIHPGPPVSVRPFGKQGALTIGNTAAVTSGIVVYATDQATALNGTAISPGDSLAWPEFKALYLYAEVEASAKVYEGTPSAPASIGAVLTGPVTIEGVVPVSGDVNVAGSVGITGPVTISGTVPVSGDLTATVTGDVNVTSGTITVGSGNVNVGAIESPVNVQGGGESLASGFADLPATGASVTVSIPLPASGMKWASIGLEIWSTNGGVFLYTLRDPSLVLLARGSGAGPALAGAGYPGALQFVGYNNSERLYGVNVTMPARSSNYPLSLILVGDGLAMIRVNYRVYGVATQLENARREMADIAATSAVVATGATQYDLYLPPSHTPYRVGLWAYSASTISLQLNGGIIHAWDASWKMAARIIFLTELGAGPGYALPANSYSEHVTGGSGYLEKVALNMSANCVLFLRQLK